MEIYVFGNVEAMAGILEGIAKLFQVKLVHTLIKATGAIALAVYIYRTIFNPSLIDAIYVRLLVPFLTIIAFLNIPPSTVAIVDIFAPSSHIKLVPNVPSLLALVASTSSRTGKLLYEVVDSVMHTPSSQKYNETGLIFGADQKMNMNNLEIESPRIQKNLKNFCYDCIVYDISYGRYSLRDLKQSADLFNFLEERSSSFRDTDLDGIREEKVDGKSNFVRKREQVNCLQAIKEIRSDLEGKELVSLVKKIRSQFANIRGSTLDAEDIGRYIPLSYRDIARSSSTNQVLAQQLMVNSLFQVFSPEKFAQKRAEALAKTNYEIMGALGSKLLVSLRTVLQAIAYFSIIFVLPLMLFPGFEGSFLNWLGLIVWVDFTWPPFYSVLNYIMEIIYQNKFDYLREMGMSIESFAAINDIEGSLHATAGMLSAAIPFISIAVLKGGWVHLSSLLSGGMQSAASTASTELASGNYSLGNSSFLNESLANKTLHQANLAPNLKYGHSQIDNGAYRSTYSQNQTTHQQNQSSGSFSLTQSHDVTESLREQEQSLQQESSSISTSLSESNHERERETTSMSEHISNSQRLSSDKTSTSSADEQKMFSEVSGVAKNMSEKTQYSADVCTKALVEASFGLTSPLGGAKGGTSGSVAFSRSALTDYIEGFSNSEEGREVLSAVNRWGKNYLDSQNSETGLKRSDDYSASIEQSISLQKQYNKTQSKIDTFSNAIERAESYRDTDQANLTQPFVNYLKEKGFGSDFVKDVLSLNLNKEEHNDLVLGFLDSLPKRTPLEMPENQSNIESDFKEKFEEVQPFLTSPDGGKWSSKENSLNESCDNLRQEVSNNLGADRLNEINKEVKFGVEGKEEKVSQTLNQGPFKTFLKRGSRVFKIDSGSALGKITDKKLKEFFPNIDKK